MREEDEGTLIAVLVCEDGMSVEMLKNVDPSKVLWETQERYSVAERRE
jgi:hypothetical protein